LREILFRGKRVDNGEWVCGYYRCIEWEIGKPSHGIINRNSFFVVMSGTVGQYTGLRDSKRTEEYPEGQRIFEGDVLFESGIEGFLGVVNWDKSGSWVVNYIDDDHDLLCEANKYGKVIGNIHENRELILSSHKK